MLAVKWDIKIPNLDNINGKKEEYTIISLKWCEFIKIRIKESIPDDINSILHFIICVKDI